nr:MAG TPA: hypothetical protein [Bacteriophage sp.]
MFLYVGGVFKTKMIVAFWQHPLSWLFYTPTQKSILSLTAKFPTKSSKIPNFTIPTPYRTPYRSNPLTKPLSATSQPKN